MLGSGENMTGGILTIKRVVALLSQIFTHMDLEKRPRLQIRGQFVR